MLSLNFSDMTLQELQDLLSMQGQVPGWEKFSQVTAVNEIQDRYNNLVAKARLPKNHQMVPYTKAC